MGLNNSRCCKGFDPLAEEDTVIVTHSISKIKSCSQDSSYRGVQETLNTSPVSDRQFSQIAKNETLFRTVLRGVSVVISDGGPNSSLASDSSLTRPDSPTVRKGGEEFLRQMNYLLEQKLKEALTTITFQIYKVKLSEKVSNIIYEFAFDTSGKQSVTFTVDDEFLEDLILQVDDYREDYEPRMNKVEILVLRDVVQLDPTLYLPLLDSFSKIGKELKAFSDFLSGVSRDREDDDVSDPAYEIRLSDIEEAKLSNLVGKLRHRRNKEHNCMRRMRRGVESVDAFTPGDLYYEP